MLLGVVGDPYVGDGDGAVDDPYEGPSDPYEGAGDPVQAPLMQSVTILWSLPPTGVSVRLYSDGDEENPPAAHPVQPRYTSECLFTSLKAWQTKIEQLSELPPPVSVSIAFLFNGRRYVARSSKSDL